MTENTIDPKLGITMCICTANRPETLARCLESLSNGIAQPAMILVSDDSPDGTATRAVCDQYGVAYLRGPRRGLCANRNSLIRQVKTSHLSLIDDDGVVSPRFIVDAMPLLKPESEKEIITGNLYESGVPVKLTNASFWGHFTQEPVGRWETIHLNCNIFPRSAFDGAEFDESIVYGYEDMDLCNRLLSQGFHIQYFPQLANNHIRPNGIPTKRLRQKEEARFYISLKRHILWQKNPAKAFLYAVLAPLQRAGHSAKTRDWEDLKHCLPDMFTAIRDVARERKRLRSLESSART